MDTNIELLVKEDVANYGRAQSFRDLKVWQKSFELTLSIYRLSACFPSEERYGMTSQMRRASVSVPSNIAEGYARLSRGEYCQSLSIASGSIAELETQYRIACSLGFCNPDAQLEAQIEAVSKMLFAMRKSLDARYRSKI